MRRVALALMGTGLGLAAASCVWSIDDSLADRAQDASSSGDASGDAPAGDVTTADQSARDVASGEAAPADGAAFDGAIADGPTVDVTVDAPAASMDAGADVDAGYVLPPPVRADGGPCPPDMVTVPIGSSSYCIDKTEVTADQYAAFLAQNIPTSVQPSECPWNTDYYPDEWDAMPQSGQVPIVGMNWCAAWVYCRSLGKRLCGHIGGGPIYFDSGDYDTAADDQWFNSCSNNGTTTFPYGNTYQGSRCVGQQYGAANPLNVDEPDACVNDQGVIDLSGNVSEWEDSCGGGDQMGCTGGAQCDWCYVRGGNFQSGAGAAMQCNRDDSDQRFKREVSVGIRCCAD